MASPRTDPPRRLAEASPAELGRVRLVATDVDGTLTTRGALTPAVVSSVAALVAAGIEVVPVSGRAAGEIVGLCRYLPGVTRGIAENGAVGIVPDEPLAWLRDPPDLTWLDELATELSEGLERPLRRAADAFCRVGDAAYERDGRADEILADLRERARARGAFLIWSSVHVHLSQDPPDKGTALRRQLETWGVRPEAVAVIGDAPNDAGLFVPGRFGLSIGTDDVAASLALFPDPPRYTTRAREGAAFDELAAALLAAR